MTVDTINNKAIFWRSSINKLNLYINQYSPIRPCWKRDISKLRGKVYLFLISFFIYLLVYIFFSLTYDIAVLPRYIFSSVPPLPSWSKHWPGPINHVCILRQPFLLLLLKRTIVHKKKKWTPKDGKILMWFVLSITVVCRCSHYKIPDPMLRNESYNSLLNIVCFSMNAMCLYLDLKNSNVNKNQKTQ